MNVTVTFSSFLSMARIRVMLAAVKHPPVTRSVIASILVLAFPFLLGVFSEEGHAKADEAVGLVNAEELLEINHQQNLQEWALALYRGAQGEVKTSEGEVALTKSNEEGLMVLSTPRAIPVKAGKTYRFLAEYRCNDATLSSLLLFRVSRPRDTVWFYDSIDRSYGYPANSFVQNSAPGQWQKRVVTFKAERDEEIVLNILLVGNPCTVELRNARFTTEPYTIPILTHRYQFPHSLEDVQKALNERKPVTATVKTNGNTASLYLNETPVAPVIYKGLKSSERFGEYEIFGKAGVPLSVVSIRLGKCLIPAYPGGGGIWVGEDHYEMAQVDEAILSVLRKNPKANVILDIWIYPYPEWGDENPQECTLNAAGETAFSRNLNREGWVKRGDGPIMDRKLGRWAYPSSYSLKFREDASRCLEAITTHLNQSPYGKAVAGFYISGGHDGQFVDHGGDYSKPALEAFREWLRRKYGTIEALNLAHRSQYQSFHDVSYPAGFLSFPKSKQEEQPFFVTGALPDFGYFIESAVWELRDHFAKVLKEGMNRPVLTLCYGEPPTFDFSQSRHLDGVGIMSFYPFRPSGYPVPFNPGNSFGRHGKLLFQELDTRSYANDGRAELIQMWLGRSDTIEEWTAVNQRLIGLSLARKFGYWHYDMGDYLADDAIRDKAGEFYKVAESLFKKWTAEESSKDAFRPDVVVISPDQVGKGKWTNFHHKIHRGNAAAAPHGMLTLSEMLLESSGVPYDVQFLSDVLQYPELQDYKVYIFLQNTFISKEDRRKIQTLLKKGNRHLVWIYDAGYISEDGPAVEQQAELIGIRPMTKMDFARRTPAYIESHPLGEGLPPSQSMSELLLDIFAASAKEENQTSAHISRYQPFWIEDATALPFARYRETGQVAMAMKEFPEWTSYYLASPNSLSGELLHRIATRAGAFVYGEPGQAAVMNEDFLSLHALKSGPYTVTLPNGRTKVKDAFSGTLVSEGAGRLQLNVVAGETYWYLLE